MTDILSPAALVPAGTIIPYLGGASAAPPDGWLYCDGTPVSRDTYGDLFAAIGATYGTGNGSTTFNLPGGTDIFFKGNGTSTGGGFQSHTHRYDTSISISVVAESGHGHTTNAGNTNSTGGSHTHTFSGSLSANSANKSIYYASNSNAATAAVGGHGHDISGTTDSVDTAHNHSINAASVGGGTSHNHGSSVNNITSGSSGTPKNTSDVLIDTRPPYIEIWHIIKT